MNIFAFRTWLCCFACLPAFWGRAGYFFDEAANVLWLEDAKGDAYRLIVLEGPGKVLIQNPRTRHAIEAKALGRPLTIAGFCFVDFQDRANVLIDALTGCEVPTKSIPPPRQ